VDHSSSVTFFPVSLAFFYSVVIKSPCSLQVSFYLSGRKTTGSVHPSHLEPIITSKEVAVQTTTEQAYSSITVTEVTVKPVTDDLRHLRTKPPQK
jgi:hypothetical protein